MFLGKQAPLQASDKMIPKLGDLATLFLSRPICKRFIKLKSFRVVFQKKKKKKISFSIENAFNVQPESATRNSALKETIPIIQLHIITTLLLDICVFSFQRLSPHIIVFCHIFL